MKITKLTDYNKQEIIQEVRSILKSGGLVIFPSDTVYGALVDATDEKAVEKLIRFKNRPPGKPISIFVFDKRMLKEYAKLTKDQDCIVSKILPGPFTVILDSTHKTSTLLESEKGTLGIRIPDYYSINRLIESYKKPVTATSANLSGRSPHYSVESMLNEFSQEKKELIDLVVDSGKLFRHKPSTIIDITQSKIKVLREGDLSFSITKTFISHSPDETRKIACQIFSEIQKAGTKKPMVIIIEGDLGVGKTVFVKAIGEKLGIEDIISPTFVIYYEYKTNNSIFKSFYHFDLYKIEEENELEHLGVSEILKPENLICVEWGEKAGQLLDLIQRKSKVVYIKMRYLNENQREILIFYSNSTP